MIIYTEAAEKECVDCLGTDLVAHFDHSIVDIYEETRFITPQAIEACFAPEIIRTQRELGRQQIRIIDVGCGTGRISSILARRFTNVQIDAIDINLDMCNLAREKCGSYPNIEQADLFEYAKNHVGEYDVVICHWIFHYIREWKEALRACTNLARRRNGVITGKLIWLNEDGDIYYAIDNLFHRTVSAGLEVPIERVNSNNKLKLSPLFKRFWQTYHTGITINPEQRAGLTLREKRAVQVALRDLGWEVPSYQQNPNQYPFTIWRKRTTFIWIIKRILETCAFSNMQGLRSFDHRAGIERINNACLLGDLPIWGKSVMLYYWARPIMANFVTKMG